MEYIHAVGSDRDTCCNLTAKYSILGCEVTSGISVRTHCVDVFHYLAVRLQQVSLFEPTAWMYSITGLWGYNGYLCSNQLYGCIPLLGCEVTTVYLCSNPLRGCIPLLGCEVTSGMSVRTHCVDVFHYVTVRLQQVYLFEPTVWMYSITWLWGYSRYLCSNPLHRCIPLLGCEVTTCISVRTHCMDVFHYVAVRLQQVYLFEPTAWMYSITWLWGYNMYLCSNPLHGCIPLLGCEVTTCISVRTHCMDVFHYVAVRLQQVSLFEPTAWMYSITLAVRLQQVSLFEPTAWMYSITGLRGYNGHLCSNQLYGCIPLLGCEVTTVYLRSNQLFRCIPLRGCEVTTGISVRTYCVDVFHYVAVRLQQVYLFEPTVWMYSITWLWGYNRYLCSNPLYGCIPLRGCEVTTGISVRTHCVDVFHYVAVITTCISVRNHCMDVFHYLAVRLQQVSLFEPTA